MSSRCPRGSPTSLRSLGSGFCGRPVTESGGRAESADGEIDRKASISLVGLLIALPRSLGGLYLAVTEAQSNPDDDDPAPAKVSDLRYGIRPGRVGGLSPFSSRAARMACLRVRRAWRRSLASRCRWVC